MVQLISGLPYTGVGSTVGFSQDFQPASCSGAAQTSLQTAPVRRDHISSQLREVSDLHNLHADALLQAPLSGRSLHGCLAPAAGRKTSLLCTLQSKLVSEPSEQEVLAECLEVLHWVQASYICVKAHLGEEKDTLRT